MREGRELLDGAEGEWRPTERCPGRGGGGSAVKDNIDRSYTTTLLRTYADTSEKGREGLEFDNQETYSRESKKKKHCHLVF